VISIEERGDVAIVRLDHRKVNVLDLEMLEAIADTMRRLADGPGVVVTGSGTVFSAGVDLGRIVEGGPEYVERFLHALHDALIAVFDHPRPVVAAVNGHALAGGCVLAAGCDVRLMSGGTIGLTELLVGVPFPTAVLEIVRSAVGPAASALALTAPVMTPDEACRIGLVDAVVDPVDLLDEAVDRAGRLARFPAGAYAMTKEQVHRPARRRIDEWWPVDAPRVIETWQSPQTQAAIAGYLDGLRQRSAARRAAD
jgi:enoyl-CoA hydratase/carnithine racemase